MGLFNGDIWRLGVGRLLVDGFEGRDGGYVKEERYMRVRELGDGCCERW